MNERIRELYKEAEKSVAFLSNSKESKQLITREKFTELIVRECLTIVERKEYSYHEADPLWETAQLIKQHFGVES